MTKSSSLGARIRARRAELGNLSIEGLAERASNRGHQLSMGAISQIETGKNENPQLDRLRALAAALDWSLSELLDGGAASAVRMIPLSELYDDPDNPREIAPADVEQDGLIASVRKLGIILSLAVRQVRHEDGRTVWAVVDGHRRLMAARAVYGPKAKTLIPCRAVVVDDSDAMLMALSANLQRADMNPIDIAKAIGGLVEHKVPTKEIANATGYKIRWVQDMAAIHLHLSPRGKEFLRAGQIGISQATGLASQRNKTLQDELLAQVLETGWNEDRIREEIKGGKPQQKPLALEETPPAAKPTRVSPSREPDWRSQKYNFAREGKGLFTVVLVGWGPSGKRTFGYEVHSQWRRQGANNTHWSALTHLFPSPPLAFLDAFTSPIIDELRMFARADDLPDLNDLFDWAETMATSLGAESNQAASVLAKADARLREAIERRKENEEQSATGNGHSDPPAAKKATAEPKPLPSADNLAAAPAWAAMMKKDTFVVLAGPVAILCKGWKEMAHALHAQSADTWTHRAIHGLLDRDAWESDEEGLPLSCDETVYRITQHWGVA